MIKKAIFLILMVGLMASAMAEKKVLYFTHEPGRWHKYTPQVAEFKAIAKSAGWEVTVSTGSYDEQVKKLKVADYAKGYDAIVYNFCFAASKDLEACANLIKQTEVNGVPAMLIHCSMHSWWGTFKKGKAAVGVSKAKADQKLVDKWKADHPDMKFPVWGDFTGVASVKHGPKKPIEVMKANDSHPALKNFKNYTTSAGTELYNNFYVTKDVITLCKGKQGNAEAIVFWEAPRGKSKIMGLSLGHSVQDFKDEGFKTMLVDGLNYLMTK
jgi:hypothetical protein